MQNLGSELTDISILIERRELERAQHRAQELMLLHPNSAPVHAIMGDIAAARRHPREAIDWYELAQRLDPNPQVAARLDRQRDQLTAQSEAEIDQMLEQTPDHRRRLVIGIIAGFIIIGVIVGLIAALVAGRPARQRAEQTSPPRPRERAGAPAVPALPEVGTPSAPTLPGARPSAPVTPRRPSSTPAAPAVDSSGRPLNITQSVDAPMADRDRLLTRSLSGITWPNGQSLGWRVQAAVDPFTGYAMVTVQIPPAMSRQDLSGVVTDMAYKMAVAAINADPGLNSLTVRVLAEVETEQRPATLVAFRANTTRDNVDYYLKRGLQPDRATIWTRVFATTWWNPSVPSGATATE